MAYGPIESAYQTCGSANIIPYALGPISKVLGSCAQIHGDSGMCWGSFLGHNVDQRDMPTNCLYEENSVEGAHLTSSEDPAGKMMNYNGQNLLQQQAQQTPTPCENWGPCASFGSYSACPTCSLSSHVGNTVLGQSATNWCNTMIQYSKPYS